MRLGAEISWIFVDFDNKIALTWIVSDPWLRTQGHSIWMIPEAAGECGLVADVAISHLPVPRPGFRLPVRCQSHWNPLRRSPTGRIFKSQLKNMRNYKYIHIV